MLNLTQDQYNRYITKSLELGELSQQPQDVPYAMIYFKSLRVEDRTELRKRLQMDIPDSAVLKFEKRDKEIICTITSVADVKNGADDAHSSDEGVEDD